MKSFLSLMLVSGLTFTALLMQGCNDNSPDSRTFTISISNITDNQPFSPVAAVIHQAGYQGSSIGKMASSDLEQLAEGGDNSHFLAGAGNDDRVYMTIGGAGLIMPGENESLVLKGGNNAFQLSLAAMLVNNNDALAIIDSVSLGDLARYEQSTFYAVAYDAGTEGNSEAMADIPGPAGGGEGYNVIRDDRNFVAVHAGVVSSEDGLATSVLNSPHRFDNPVARIMVARTD